MKKSRKIVLIFLSVFTLIFTIHIVPNSKHIVSEVEQISETVGNKLVALTFDDGPNENTEVLLDGLRERNIKSTFFVLGKRAEKHPDTVKTMYEDGHLIGNHTYSHPNFLVTKKEDYLDEIKKTDEIIKNITGQTTEFFRPPYGKYDAVRIKSVDKINVCWSLDTIDWKHKDADYVYNKLINSVKDGDIVLMHDIHETTVDGVLRAIDDLIEKGFEFVRVDELLNRNGQSMKSGVVYRKCKDGKSQVAF